jgi:hypothetical protein
LALDAGAARRSLGVGTRWPLDIAVQHTMQWYRDWYAGQAAQALCARDIEAWEAAE